MFNVFGMEKFEITPMVYFYYTSEFFLFDLYRSDCSCISRYLKMGGKIRYVFLDEYV